MIKEFELMIIIGDFSYRVIVKVVLHSIFSSRMQGLNEIMRVYPISRRYLY